MPKTSLPPSYQSVDYRVRLAKSTERKVLMDIFHKLPLFHPISNYQYIGLGSIFFSDIILFHKTVGFNKIISIEKNEDDKERFEFNNPYPKWLKVRFGNSTDVLYDIDLKIPTVLWLDYDSHFDSFVIDDLNVFLKNSVSGSFIAVTVNVSASPNVKAEYKRYSSIVKESRISGLELKQNDCNKVNLPKTISKFIQLIVSNAIKDKNLISTGQNFAFKQIMNLFYQDGARMLTFGGFIVESGDEDKYGRLCKEEADLINAGEIPENLSLPKLTIKEVLLLERLINCEETITNNFNEIRSNSDQNPLKYIDDDQVKCYIKYRKYYPLFGEFLL